MPLRLMLFIGGLLMAPFLHAETRYISDELRVPLRSSPCNSCAIVHRGLLAGTKLTILETNSEGWSHVKTGNDTEGWLPERYLVKEQIARERIKTVAEETEKLRALSTEQEAEIGRLNAKQSDLLDQLATLEKAAEERKSELVSIKQISGNALNLHAENEDLLKQNRMLQNEIDVLTARMEHLANNNSRTMFLYGALAVIAGMLMAVLIPRLKRRRGYSEWV